MNIPMLDIPRLHEPFQEELEEAFRQLSRSGRYINGPAVAEFEQSLTGYTGARFAAAVSSGTDALLCALMALGVKPGDEVITTTYTFFATAGCIARLCAVPVFVDAQADSFNIDPSAIEAAITPRTVGIVPVHLFGRCADMTAVNAIARKFHLFVIEDAAQAIGAGHGGKAAGTMGDAAIFSFFPAKNLGALGDAGAIVTNDGRLDEQIRILRSHGARQKYHHTVVGGNFRIDTLQAAMLQIKLRHLNDWTQGRRRVAVRYHAGFEGHPDIRTPQEGGDFHVYNQYVLRLPADRRDRIREALTAAGIGSANYYPAPLHLQPCFASPGQRPADLPVAEALCGQNLALPIDPNLTDGQIDEVVATVKEAL